MRRSHPNVSTVWILAPLVCLFVAGCAGRSPEEHLKAGEKLLSDGKKKEAIAEFSKAIEVDPECVNAYLNRAMCYNETGQPKRAVADFSKAIELDPTNAYSYDQRALLYRTVLNEPSKAAADTAKAEAIRGKRWDELKDLRKQKPKRGR